MGNLSGSFNLKGRNQGTIAQSDAVNSENKKNAELPMVEEDNTMEVADNKRSDEETKVEAEAKEKADAEAIAQKKAEQEKRKAEREKRKAEERARKEAEERARKEAEERARKEAEEKSKKRKRYADNKTVYSLLVTKELMAAITQKADEMGVSKNALINFCVKYALENGEKEMKEYADLLKKVIL